MRFTDLSGQGFAGQDPRGSGQTPDSLPGTRKRRILQIFSRYRQYGGEEGSVYRIGEHLQSENDLGTFITSSDGFFEGRGRRMLAVAKAFRNWTVADRLRYYQKLGRYDVWMVHNVFPAMSPVVYELAFRWKIPVIQYLHNYRLGCVNGFFLEHGKPCQRCMHGNFLPALLTGCWHESRIQSGYMGAITAGTRALGLFGNVARWIAISESQKREHVRMGIPSERISVIPHFYLPDEGAVPPYPQRGDVVFVGRLSEEKGVDALLRAWIHVQDSGRRLVIVGDGPSAEALKSLTGELSLRNVIFTGFLDRAGMDSVWMKAACSVVPSVWKEPFGMVVLEAWAKARPVVAHRIGALPEIIRDRTDGMLAEPSDPRALSEAILHVLCDPARASQMGRSGRQRLEADFGLDRWMNSMRATLETVSPLMRDNAPSAANLSEMPGCEGR